MEQRKRTFQEIRDFDYDVAALLGIAPTETYLWIVPKQILLANTFAQRRGASGRGSRWFKFPSDRPPQWLRRWGGTFLAAQHVLEEASERFS